MIGGPAFGIKGDVSDIVAEIRLNRSGAEANARLIAMAPEMLSALQEFVESFDKDLSDLLVAKIKAQSVIAKALKGGK